MDRARAQRADVFVSIHADAFRDARARGASVYALSSRGASSEAARWLAERENTADLVGGVSLDEDGQTLARRSNRARRMLNTIRGWTSTSSACASRSRKAATTSTRPVLRSVTT